jgi:signal transduction histidine kinase
MKSDFVSTVSHEMRTPLTCIAGYLELLMDDAAGPLTDEQRQLVVIAQRNCSRLASIAEDLLVLSRGDLGCILDERVTLPVRAVVDAAVRAVAGLLTERRLEFEVDTAQAHGRIAVDPAQLERAVTNLLSNAIKFTPDGGRIRIGASSDQDTVTIAVRDTGIGISAADQENLFERFFRTDEARHRAIQGTGLGLAIVRDIVQAHGGTVVVDSVPDCGSTMTIRLPAAPSLA